MPLKDIKMLHAKTNNTNLIKYPYTFTDLREENPYSRYDGRFTLSEWYAQTDDATATEATVVEVVIADQPEYGTATHYLSQKQTPELIDGVWTIGWDIVERPPVIEGDGTSGSTSSAAATTASAN